jgi:hypothetical protein
MIARSTKAKRRKNRSYHRAVAGITVSCIDSRNGCRFYLVSRSVTPSQSIHLEANGPQHLEKQYRAMLEQCRALAASTAGR